MIFVETGLKGAFIIEPERLEDERGFFARTWCKREFESHGLSSRLLQCSVSFNARQGTLRGMHFQRAPHQEAKLIRCTMGAIYDVIIDLRPGSSTFKEHVAVELTAQNHLMLYAPEGFAHGFITLSDNSQIMYQMSEFYSPGHTGGVRWNDPAFAIQWPIEVQVMADKDRNLPDFNR